MGFNDRMAFNFTQMDFCHFRCSMHIQQFVNISSTNSFFFIRLDYREFCAMIHSRKGAQKWFLEKMPKKPKNYSSSSKFMLDSFTSREEATPRMGWFSNIQSHQIVVIFLQFWGKKNRPRNEQMRKNSSPTKFMVVSFTFTRMYYIII